ncbi:COP9/signalosome complex subunit 7a [Schizosaccharomyces pombe]|uniref:COP9 signalosome complex subunit 7 n=1 Tax=Schizosaccharomyces pombe (strain 972 / ATCC 24843) TaxID=284812 RepID=CSN7_SCHPO|nr:putative COP9/signalosome complex subunit 7a [Schizosaccharomyces pombe]Q9UUJ7.1 RecName: Full=COP9 signalosome complex subunit 7 [Schizosaccharomyces pombe 972h-]CAB52576.1 COP9/signalosome complex subunit 7a (predicted) [Schizosaccharomyces pombe]|eukprot:NP_594814.1 putative COP9/signalosome complex subunit 7a [Schizosaccharomyces pombe]
MEEKISQAIDDPNVFCFQELWIECQEVQKSQPIDSAVLRTLEIFCRGDIRDASSEWNELRFKKLRLLTLIDLANRHVGSSVSFETILVHLQLDRLPPSDPTFTVEYYIMQAMMNQILVGKINAKTQTLHVSWALERFLDSKRIDEMKYSLDRFIERCSNILFQLDAGTPSVSKSFKRASRMSSSDGIDYMVFDKRPRPDDTDFDL